MQDQKRIKHSHAENRPVYNQYFFLHRIGKSSPHRALCTGFRSAHILLLLSYVDAPHHVTETIITKPPTRLNPNLQNLRFHQKTPSNEDFANKTAPEPQPKSLQSRRWLIGSSAATFSESAAGSSPEFPDDSPLRRSYKKSIIALGVRVGRDVAVPRASGSSPSDRRQ